MGKFLVLPLFLCSFVTGGVLFFFSLRLLPASGPGGFDGYAALALAESAPDREIAGILEAALGRPVASESSQWVFLNSFEGLEQVSLEDYEGRLEAFDPRRDGYAKKLKDFFVRDGRRWFFIPLDRKLFGSPFVLNPAQQLEKRIGPALAGVLNPGGGDLPSGSFSLLMKPPARPLGFRILLFALAWAAALVFPPGARRPEGPARRGRGRRLFFRSLFAGIPPERRRLLLLAPLMFPLSLWGAPGFAFIALSLFLGAVLAEPLKECWIRLLGRKSGRRTGFYRFRFLYGLPLVLFLAFIPWIGGMPPVLVFLNFLGFSLFFFFSLGLEIRRKFAFSPVRGPSLYGPCRFVPLPILPFRLQANPLLSAKGARPRVEGPANSGPGAPVFPFPGKRKRTDALMLPFALASCLAALSASLGGDFGFYPRPSAAPDWPSLVGEHDYLAHVLFQTGFARRSLQSGAPELEEPGYFRYTLGEDGLVAGALPLSPGDPEIPPFPLAELTEFLAAWGSGEPAGIRGLAFLWPAVPLADLLSPLLVFLVVFPARRGWKKVPVYADKRIAA
jgi:hypothetical protein